MKKYRVTCGVEFADRIISTNLHILTKLCFIEEREEGVSNIIISGDGIEIAILLTCIHLHRDPITQITQIDSTTLNVQSTEGGTTSEF